MSVLVVGSIALDSVKTPSGQANHVVGGSALYFSVAASFFTEVALVGIIGKDFPENYLRMLEKRGVDISGVQVSEGETFRWIGDYTEDINRVKTVSVCQNVMENFTPALPDRFRKIPYVFLANIEPEVQSKVLEMVNSPNLAVCDTMNFWIERDKDILYNLMKRVNVMMVNDEEARLLTGKKNVIEASKEMLTLGPSVVVIKKGEHGAILATKRNLFVVPAYPVSKAVDPTGAGDSFGGGFIGYIASTTGNISEENMRKAVVYGIVIASFTVEDFSTRKLERITMGDIEERVEEMRNLVKF